MLLKNIYFITRNINEISDGGAVASHMFQKEFANIFNLDILYYSNKKPKIILAIYTLLTLKPIFSSKVELKHGRFVQSLLLFDGIQAAAASLNASDNTPYIYIAHNAEAKLFWKSQTAFNKCLRFLEYFMYRRLENRIIKNALLSVFLTKTDELDARATIERSIVLMPDFGTSDAHVGTGDYILISTNFHHPPSKRDFYQMLGELPIDDHEHSIVVSGKGVPIGQLKTNIRGVGFLPRKEYLTLLKQAKYVIAPNYTGSGFPYKIVEAVRYGKLTFLIGDREIISPCKTLLTLNGLPTSINELNEYCVEQNIILKNLSLARAVNIKKIKDNVDALLHSK